MPRIIVCKECNEKKNHYAKGLCNKCWQRRRDGTDKEEAKIREECKKGIRWSLHYDYCIGCGTTERKHIGHGLCIKCWDKEYLKKYKFSEVYQRNKKKYYQSEKCKDTTTKYHQSKAGKESLRKYNSKRRLQLKGFINIIGISQGLQQKIMQRDKVCIYCGGILDAIDHIQAVNNGGNNNYNNLVGCCKSCNSSKGKKDVFVWCKDKGIKVPDIVIELVRRQDEQRKII